VVIVLPIVLVLLVFGLGGGQTRLVLLLPMALVLGAGAVVITVVLREARPGQGRYVRRLPSDHLRRQLYLATRPRRRAEPKQSQDEKPD
jgi:hypothetical protein